MRMLRAFWWGSLCFLLLSSCAPERAVDEAVSRHFFYGQPQGTPVTNDLIVRQIYALSSNDNSKMADWVCYRLDLETVDGDVKTARRWQADPLLREEETLEPEDYRGAHAALGVDRGHLAPLASFKGTAFWHETNYLSNITPQKSNLNQGPWRILEEKVRELVRTGETVWVMTGPLFEREMPALPGADETHRVPSGYWKIICVGQVGRPESIKVAAFVFDQDTPRTSPILDHLVRVDDVEQRSGLDVMHALPDGLETRVEGQRDTSWVRQHF